jgi:hypothetical protein
MSKKSDTTYFQCKLVKGNKHTTSWIPKIFAHTGLYLQLKMNGEWEDGWLVISVGDIELNHETLMSRSQDYMHTRKASDI